MADAGANVKVVSYPGAKHSFTNPDAGKAGMPQLAYNADGRAKSWAAMLEYLQEEPLTLGPEGGVLSVEGPEGGRAIPGSEGAQSQRPKAKSRVGTAP